MSVKAKQVRVKKAFTLIELLVVMAIIALLIGILVPGMRSATRHAKNLKQKAAYHSMEVSLEFFVKAYDDYPPSASYPDGQSNKIVCGAQHLAEALAGRDEMGFDPKTRWHKPGEDTVDDLYRNDDSAEGKASLKRRKDLFIEIEDTGIFTMDDLYDDYAGSVHTGTGTEWNRAPVITDVFRRKKIIYNGKSIKTGSPVLYFKANTTTRAFRKVPGSDDDISKWIYNYNDNMAIADSDYGLGTIRDVAVSHELTEEKFYKKVTNPHVYKPQDSMYDKPYNAATYILWSAGWDEVFGTKDDIVNF